MLNTLKLAGCTKVTDSSLSTLVKQTPMLEHLEMNRCALTADEVTKALSPPNLPNLRFVDLTSVPGLTKSVLTELQQKRPQLALRQFRRDKVDPKDNGLRVPRRVIEKEGKKKKGKKKK